MGFLIIFSPRQTPAWPALCTSSVVMRTPSGGFGNSFTVVLWLFTACFLLPHVQPLRHFGYYGAKVGELRLLRDAASRSPLPPVANTEDLGSQINTIFVGHTWGPYAANMTALGEADSVDLASAARANLDVILEPTIVCWTPVGAHWALRPDWEARWATYWGIVSKSPGRRSLVALYPVDEPNGSEQLGVVTPRLHVDTAGVPIIAVLSQAGVLAMDAGTYELPHEIDWLGFDAYGCWDSCYQGHSVPDYLRMIEAAVGARANRLIVVVPDAMSALVNGTAAVPSLAVQQAKLASVRKYTAYCESEQQRLCVAMLPFLWKGVSSCCGGLETLPLLQPYYRELGARVKNNNPNPNPNPNDEFALSLFTDPMAVCLDGSRAGFYKRPGTNESWVIELEGGGWCFDEADCLARAKTKIGSSKGWPRKGCPVMDGGSKGMLSSDCAVSSLCKWTAVHLNYCDGASFAGFKREPVTVNGTALYFRGRANLDAAIDALLADGMSEAKEIVFKGCSAGGLATILHMDYFAARVHAVNPRTRVTAMPDAGFFLDHSNVRKQPTWTPR